MRCCLHLVDANICNYAEKMHGFLGKTISYFSAHFMLLKTSTSKTAERKEQT